MNLKYQLHKHRTLITLIGSSIISLLISDYVNASSSSSPIWTMTSYFGELDDVHTIPHKGVDFAMPIGTPLDSIVDGTVTDVRHADDRSWGTSVHITDTQGREVIYGHLNDSTVNVGDVVHKGDLIAHSGNTGRSTGAHLHLEIKINGKSIDPMRDIVGRALGNN